MERCLGRLSLFVLKKFFERKKYIQKIFAKVKRIKIVMKYDHSGSIANNSLARYSSVYIFIGFTYYSAAICLLP